MSTDPALVFIYVWLAVFFVYVGWLFYSAYRKGGPRW